MFRRRERISLQQRKRLNKKRQRRGILFLVSGISDTCGSCFGGIYDVQAGSSQP